MSSMKKAMYCRANRDGAQHSVTHDGLSGNKEVDLRKVANMEATNLAEGEEGQFTLVI